jgi:hypothetical protein
LLYQVIRAENSINILKQDDGNIRILKPTGRDAVQFSGRVPTILEELATSVLAVKEAATPRKACHRHKEGGNLYRKYRISFLVNCALPIHRIQGLEYMSPGPS